MPSALKPRPASIRLANTVSYVLNPFVLPAVFFGLALAHFDAPRAEIGAAVGLGLFFFLLLPLSFLVWMVTQGRTATLDVPERARRTAPYLVGLFSYAAAFVVLLRTGWTASALLLAVVAVHFLNTVIFLLINLRWKISVHTSGLAGFISMLFFVAVVPWEQAARAVPLLQPVPVLLLLPLIPLMAWSRVRLRAHTPLQAVAGAVFGLVVPFVELALIYRLGLLAAI